MAWIKDLAASCGGYSNSGATVGHGQQVKVPVSEGKPPSAGIREAGCAASSLDLVFGKTRRGFCQLYSNLG